MDLRRAVLDYTCANRVQTTVKCVWHSIRSKLKVVEVDPRRADETDIAIRYFKDFDTLFVEIAELKDIAERLSKAVLVGDVRAHAGAGPMVLKAEFWEHAATKSLFAVIREQHATMGDYRLLRVIDYSYTDATDDLQPRVMWHLCRVSAARFVSSVDGYLSIELRRWLTQFTAHRYYHCASMSTRKKSLRSSSSSKEEKGEGGEPDADGENVSAVKYIRKSIEFDELDAHEQALSCPGTVLNLHETRKPGERLRRMEVVRPGRLVDWHSPHRILSLYEIMHIVDAEHLTLDSLMFTRACPERKGDTPSLFGLYLRHVDVPRHAVKSPTRGLTAIASLICTYTVDAARNIVRIVNVDDRAEVTKILDLVLFNELRYNPALSETVVDHIQYSNMQFTTFANTDKRGWFEYILPPILLLLCRERFDGLRRLILRIPDSFPSTAGETADSFKRAVSPHVFSTLKSRQEQSLNTFERWIELSLAEEKAAAEATAAGLKRKAPAPSSDCKVENTPHPHKVISAMVSGTDGSSSSSASGSSGSGGSRKPVAAVAARKSAIALDGPANKGSPMKLDRSPAKPVSAPAPVAAAAPPPAAVPGERVLGYQAIAADRKPGDQQPPPSSTTAMEISSGDGLPQWLGADG
jgi:hypothetical protein